MNNFKILIFFIVLIFFSILSIFCQEMATIYIKAGKIFTGQHFSNNMIIVINGDRITQLVKPDQIIIPESAKIIDASTMTVTPGLIDGHVHISGSSYQYIKEINKRGWGKLVEESMSKMASNREHFLLNGVTTVMDMGGVTQELKTIIDADKKGDILSPELLFCGPLFTAPQGHPAGTIYHGLHYIIDNGTRQVTNKQDIETITEQEINTGVDYIKIVYDSGDNTLNRLDLDAAERIIKKAHTHNKRVFTHIYISQSEALDMIKAGSDGLEHCFIGDNSDKAIKLMAEKGIFLTPTLSIFEIFTPELLPEMQKIVKKAYDAGVPIVTGTDFPSSKSFYAGEDIYNEMRLLQDSGISRQEVLKAATYNAAQKAAKEHEIGQIAPGYKANLVFFADDLSKGEISAKRINMVMYHGKIISQENKLKDEYRPLFGHSSIPYPWPYIYWSPHTDIVIGTTLIEYDLFDTGITVIFPGDYSLKNWWYLNPMIFIPSPFTNTQLQTSFIFDNYNKFFYGMGNNTNLSHKLQYKQSTIRGSISSITLLWAYFFLNTNLTFDYKEYSQYEDQSLPTETGFSGGYNTILSFTLSYDNRDTNIDPWSGGCYSVEYGFSHPYIFSTYEFSKLTLDISQFVSIFHRHILATHFKAEQCFGNIPFYFKPSFGGSNMGRGYSAHRFIGNSGLFLQMEYRFQILSFIAAVLFMDMGQVQDNFSYFQLPDFKFTGGFGPCLNFQDNVILCFNIGFSTDEWGFYFRYGHAF